MYANRRQTSTPWSQARNRDLMRCRRLVVVRCLVHGAWGRFSPGQDHGAGDVLQFPGHDVGRARRTGLFDTKTGLFWRDSSFVNGDCLLVARKRLGHGRHCESACNTFPPLTPATASYVTLLKTMAAALVPYQQSDGTWHSDLTHPQTYANPEVSGTGLITYAIAYGINQGLLDRGNLSPRGGYGLERHDEVCRYQGLVGYIQATGSALRLPQPPRPTTTVLAPCSSRPANCTAW